MRPILADKRTIFMCACIHIQQGYLGLDLYSGKQNASFFVFFFFFFDFQHLNFSAAS